MSNKLKFEKIRKKNEEELIWLFKKIEKASAQFQLPANYQKVTLAKIAALQKRNELLFKKLNQELTKLDKLNNLVKELKKENENVASENYLLQYKKKDLLVLANNLEDAYDEISEKNKEIMLQAQELQRVNEEINRQKEEIEEKTEELELRKEELEDQADYLHEVNERISEMHRELEKQKDEILSKNEELVSLNEEKNNLIGIVAHDLKSPLNQIEALVNLIKLTSNLDEEPLQFLEIINSSANRLNAMISKILDIETIESQKLNLNFEPVDLAGLLSQIVDHFKITADAKNISLITQFEADKAMVEIDQSFANQVFENLVSNAVKFSPNDKNIFINLKLVDGHWQAEIKDEGPGLSEDDHKKLFGKYQKLSAKPTGNESSTGLGLSIVKKYVVAMSGQIWCESQLGHGASFYVSFEQL